MNHLRTGIALILAMALFTTSAVIMIRKRTLPQRETLVLPRAKEPATTTRAAATRPAATNTYFRRIAQIEPEYRARIAQLDEVLSSPQRQMWTVLPEWINKVWFDRNGQALFGATSIPLQPPELEHLSIEEFSAGHSRVLHSASFSMIDSKNRIWHKASEGMECYDGEKWTRYTLAPRTGATTAPSAVRGPGRNPNARNSDRVFEDLAFEDSVGNCWFLATSDQPGLILVQVKPDGTKQEFPINDPLFPARAVGYAQQTFFEHADGNLTLVLPMSERSQFGSDHFELRIFRFDGQKWRPINPHFCEHGFDFVIPQQDGSLKLICTAGRIWTYWPDNYLEKMRQQASSWFNELDNPDPLQRETANRGLLAIGPQLETLLPSSKDEELSPSARATMQQIRENYQKMGRVDERGLHSELASYDAGLEVGAAMPIARTYDGGAVLTAQPIKQANQDDVMPRGFLQIDRNGHSTVRAVPPQQFIRPFAGGASPGHGWADSTGELWRSDHVRITDSEQYQISTRRSAAGVYGYAMPPGASVEDFFGEDADGRLYFRMTRRVVIYDRKLPTGRTWGVLQVTGDSLTASPEGRSGWAFVYSNTNGTRLLNLSAAGARTINVPSAVEDYSIIPLGGKLVLLETSDPYKSGRSFLYDGVSQWLSAADSRTLIKENIDIILPSAVAKMNVRTDSTRIAADLGADEKPRGLWLSARKQSAASIPSSTNPAANGRTQFSQQMPLDYYDGTSWHDAAIDLRDLNPTYLGEVQTTMDHGHTIALQPTRTRTPLFISYSDSGKLSAQLGKSNAPLRVSSAVYDHEGLWSGTGGTNTTLYYLHEGQVDAFADKSYRPQLCDRHGRVWFIHPSGRELVVKDGDEWIKLPIASLDREARIFEGPDGRLWLAQIDAISLIALDNTGGQKSVLLERFAWDGPKERIDESFIDERNGIWIYADSRRIARYALPNATVPTTAATTQPVQ